MAGPVRIIPTEAIWGSTMRSARECREFGAKCLHWAKTAQSEDDRQVFLRMAREWLYAAANLDVRLITRPISSSSDGVEVVSPPLVPS